MAGSSDYFGMGISAKLPAYSLMVYGIMALFLYLSYLRAVPSLSDDWNFCSSALLVAFGSLADTTPATVDESPYIYSIYVHY